MNISATTKNPKTVRHRLLRKKKDNTRKLFEKWLKADAQFEGNIIEEHDTTL